MTSHIASWAALLGTGHSGGDTHTTSLPETVFRWNLVGVGPSDPEVSSLNQTLYPSIFLARVSRCRVWALHWCPTGPGSSKWSPPTRDSGTKDPPQRCVRPERAEPPRPRGQALLLAAGSAVCTPFTKGCLPAATCQRTQVLEVWAFTTSELALNPPSPCARAGEGSL